MAEPQRPDPDRLLQQVQQDEARERRGRLKIFFGASAGVGKTYAMLGAARAAQAQGAALVVGLVETHGRADTEAMARGLPKNNRNAHVMTVLINVPVTWILVKYYDLRGAAISTAAYTAIFGGMMFFFTRKDLPQYVGYAVKRLSASILCLSAAIALLFFATPEAFWKIEKLQFGRPSTIVLPR